MKDFAPYQQSLELKELGFDEPCFANYTVIPEDKIDWFTIPEQGITNKTSFGSSKNYNSKYFEEEGTISAPTYSQAFRWFREKYGLHQNITQYYGERFYFKIEDMFFPRRHEDYPIEKLRDLGEYVSQEEAELACLNKLIEIVKDGK
jgi:hypothetical protein